MSRTKKQEIARFTWLDTEAVATVLGCKEDLVRDHIRAGSFPDIDGDPGVIDIASGPVPRYRINPKSLDAYIRKSKVRPAAKASAA